MALQSDIPRDWIPIPLAIMTLLRTARSASPATSRYLALASVAAAVLGVAACQGDAARARTPGERARATVVRNLADTPRVRPPAADASTGEEAVVRGVTAGDRACYVDLEVDGVRKPPQEAAFDLCEHGQRLVGKRVSIARHRSWVLAGSCEGDPECPRRDTVNLIVTATPVPARPEAQSARP
jgi:hypothetical protein